MSAVSRRGERLQSQRFVGGLKDPRVGGKKIFEFVRTWSNSWGQEMKTLLHVELSRSAGLPRGLCVNQQSNENVANSDTWL